MRVWQLVALALVAAGACAGADNATRAGADACAPGLWGGLLEEWALSAPDHAGRHGRVMSLPPTKGYYVSDRIDLMPPPPPPYHHGPPHSGLLHKGPALAPSHSGPHSGPPHNGPSHNGPPHSGPSHNGPSYSGPPHNGAPHREQSSNGIPHSGPTNPGSHPHPSEKKEYSQYDEWQASPPPPPAGGKIVNKPPKPYKDQFRPSYAPPSPSHPLPLPQQQWGGAADRLDEPPPAPQKQVSETDLYLLSAIEKLVYRVDLMEKRLRKVEETMHYLVVGKDTKPEPCASNFTRVGSNCYYVSPEAGDWKAASLRCRKMRTHLLELDDDDERRTVLAALLADKRLKGTEFWTGGLNPGLLWIWAHSARPVLRNATAGADAAGTVGTSGTVVGDGRCLSLAHDPALGSYVYRGRDCAARHRFVCELPDETVKEKLSNEVERVARELRTAAGGARRARLAWVQEP